MGKRPNRLVLVHSARAGAPEGTGSAGVKETSASLPSPSERRQAALNAVLGDYLERRGNPLALQMAFYQRGLLLPLTAAGLQLAHPGLGPRAVVFVHGMGQTEGSWSFAGDPSMTYGSLLQAELGVTPFYVRYNTGRRVSQNGRELAALLERLVQASPVVLDEITLIGHSLGGLVIRSACYYAGELRLSWLPRLRRAVYLGAPHLGSPFEKAGHVVATVLGAIDHPVVQLIHTLSDIRGPGVKDLRRGSLLDEDWQVPAGAGAAPARPKQVPLCAGVEHYFVAGTLTRNANHPATLLFGDALVRLSSAVDPARRSGLPPDHIAVLPGVNHVQLAHCAEAYARIRGWLGAAPGAQAVAAQLRLEPDEGKSAAPVARALGDLERLGAHGALLEDAVDRGTREIQDIQETLSARPYDMLQTIPAVGSVSNLVRRWHFASMRATYAAIRLLNRASGLVLRAAIAQRKASSGSG